MSVFYLKCFCVVILIQHLYKLCFLNSVTLTLLRVKSVWIGKWIYNCTSRAVSPRPILSCSHLAIIFWFCLHGLTHYSAVHVNRVTAADRWKDIIATCDVLLWFLKKRILHTHTMNKCMCIRISMFLYKYLCFM